jgi:hypothetical protein
MNSAKQTQSQTQSQTQTKKPIFYIGTEMDGSTIIKFTTSYNNSHEPNRQYSQDNKNYDNNEIQMYLEYVAKFGIMNTL